MSSVAPHLAPHRRMTLEEWESLPEDVEGELVDGELVEEEVSDFDHEGVVAWFVWQLCAWLVPRGGRVYGSDGKLAVRASQGRKPDACAFFGARRPPRHGASRVPPDVILEVISSDPRDERRDRVEKAAEYAGFGVRFYWLADPDQHTFEVFGLEEGGYRRLLCASEGTVEVPGCDGLRLNLDDL